MCDRFLSLYRSLAFHPSLLYSFCDCLPFLCTFFSTHSVRFLLLSCGTFTVFNGFFFVLRLHLMFHISKTTKIVEKKITIENVCFSFCPSKKTVPEPLLQEFFDIYKHSRLFISYVFWCNRFYHILFSSIHISHSSSSYLKSIAFKCTIDEAARIR